MYTMYLSNHYAAPLILDHENEKSKQIMLQAFHRGINLYKILSASDRETCIKAWDRLKENIESQLKYHQLN